MSFCLSVSCRVEKERKKEKKSHLTFSDLYSVQGAREEGPADLERADADAQVII